MLATVKNPAAIAAAVVVLLVAALAVVATTPSPSSAAGHQHCFTDPAGDARTPDGEQVDDGRADILEVCGAYETDALTFSMRLAAPTDPAADAGWQDGEAMAIWHLQAQAQAYGGPTGQVAFMVVDGGVRVVATWFDDQTPVCEGTGTFDGAWYEATFDPRCLDVPAVIAFNGYFQYDDDPADPNRLLFDVAPEGMGREGEGRFDGPLTREGVSPTAERLAGRFSGQTRIDTAVAISRAEFPHGAEEVYLARADDFPDALAAGSLTRGPILLVPQCGPLPQTVGFEIDRLRPRRVIALGGQAAVCDALLHEARDL